MSPLQKRSAEISVTQRNRLNTIVSHFTGSTKDLYIEPLGQGNINDTYLVECSADCFVLQRINGDVFPNPEHVVENTVKILTHLQKTRFDRRQVLPSIVKTLAGGNYYKDADIWRAQTFIENSEVFLTITESSKAIEIGRCLAQFHKSVEELEPAELYDPLPGFHNLPGYLAKYDEAMASSEKADSAEIARCIEMVEMHRVHGHFFSDALRDGKIKRRVVHGDPKVSNIIFNRDTGSAVTMIDLDTVGPGILLYDIGDCLRSCCLTGGEESQEEVIACNVDMVANVLRGYAEKAKLTPFEVESVYTSLYLATFELAVRFFTDHLVGDTYFNIQHAGDNLHRANNQFTLLESIEKQKQEIRRLTYDIFCSHNRDKKEK